MTSQTDTGAWSRELAADLFPGTTTPFAWTALRAPAETALRRTWADLGAPAPADAPLWRRADDGRVYVDAAALTSAARALHGAAWLIAPPAELSQGLMARWQAGGVIRRAQARIAATQEGVAGLQTRTAKWLAWVRGLRWAQADLLQVMEELEPQAQNTLQAYFTLRAGVAAAHAQVAGRLADWLSPYPTSVIWTLYAGLEGLPSVEAAYAVAIAARDSATQMDTLARFGHRGPNEMRPDALRWLDSPALLAGLADRRPLRNPDSARVQCQAAEAWIFGQLDSGKSRQIEPLLAHARDLCRAADRAWDAFVMVIAAAQCWVQAIASEAVAATLIAQSADVLYLELEELKQVATGEWHPGRGDEVREAVVARRQAQAATRTLPDSGAAPRSGSPGQAQGPAYLAAPGDQLPPQGAIWLGEIADAGCAPFWLSAGALTTAAADAWSPGLIAARALGIPAVIGAPTSVAQAAQGCSVAVDADADHVQLED